MYNTWCVKALRGHVFVSLQSIERYPTPRALRTAAQTSPWSCWTPSRRTRPLPRSSGSTACTTSPSTPSCRAATQELLRYVILSWLHRCCAGGKTISVWCLHGRGDHEQVSRASDICFFLCQIKLEGVYRVGWSMHQSVSGKKRCLFVCCIWRCGKRKGDGLEGILFRTACWLRSHVFDALNRLVQAVQQ